MRKISSFVLLIFTVMSCLFFSACENKYKNLKMSVLSLEGENIQVVELVKDNDDLKNLESKEISIKITGVDEKDIGTIKVASYPSELITTSDYRYESKFCKVKLNAKTTGKGKLVVTHTNSNKTTEIDLAVSQKAESINLLSETYVIPTTSQTQEILLNSSSILEMLPKGQYITDKVGFVASQNLTGVQLIKDEGTGYIIGFNVSANVVGEISCYPVLSKKGYEDLKFESKKITFKFVEKLDNSKLNIVADNNNINAEISKNNIIYLLSNDTNLNTFSVKAQYNNNPLTGNILNLYRVDYSIVGDSNLVNNISVVKDNNNYHIHAKGYTDKAVDVVFKLVPKFAGSDLFSERVIKTIKVKGELLTQDITTFVQGEKVDVANEIDLYNYYVSSSNAQGLLFNFETYPKQSFEQFKQFKISVPEGLLNTVCDNSGVNPVSNLNESELKLKKTNRYVLNFYINSQPLVFSYDVLNGRFISNPFDGTNNIFVKYETISSNTVMADLEMTVESVNKKDYSYLETAEMPTIEINFKKQEGVKELNLFAGSETTNLGAVEQTYITNEQGGYKFAEKIYIDRNSLDKNLLYFSNNSVIGYNVDDPIQAKVVSDAEFDVKIENSSNFENPINLALVKNGEYQNQNSEFTFKYLASSSAEGDTSPQQRSIYFVFNKNTSIGEYKIKISQSNGFVKNIYCYIYESVKSEDIGFDITLNNQAFENIKTEFTNYTYDENIWQTDAKSLYVLNNGKYELAFEQSTAEEDLIYDENTLYFEKKIDYIFKDYFANYIVSADTTKFTNVELETLLSQDIINSNIIKNYNFVASLVDIEDKTASELLTYQTELVGTNADRFINKEPLANNKIKLSFNEGSYNFDTNKNQYIKLDLVVGIKTYKDILTENTAIEEKNISLIFFVYEEIKDKDINLNNQYLKRYGSNLLGAYNTNDSVANLSVSLTNEKLWKYVQLQNQNLNAGGDEQFKVCWINNTSEDRFNVDNVLDNQITLSFEEIDTRQIEIVAQVKQFYKTFNLRCVIDVEKAVISEKVIVKNKLNQTPDGNSYIDLKLGEELTIQAENYSRSGNITNPATMLVVIDSFGNVDNSLVVVDNNKIKVKDEGSIKNLKLLVIAKDALNTEITSTTSGLNNIRSFMLEGGIVDRNNYKNAYVVIDLIITDGITNPYLIYDETDFWEIDDNESLKTKNYRLMRDIYLTQSDSISDFSGTIDTYSTIVDSKNYVYNFSIHATLNNDSLFKNFAGTIENVNFVVNYNSQLSATENEMCFGVFDNATSYAQFINITSELGGSITINSDNAQKVYVGGLIGNLNTDNFGYEQEAYDVYVNKKLIGVTGSVEIKNLSSQNVYFGGLVGKNNGTISGFITSGGLKDQNMLSNLTIKVLENTTENATNNLIVGGVVGYNIANIQNAVVGGKIIAESAKCKAIGGVIGENETTATDKVISTITLQDSNISVVSFNSENKKVVKNIVSSAEIDAINSDNVGGIVGNDNGGYYYDCHYQIWAKENNTKASIIAKDNVGGIAGYSLDGKFEFCSVMSYKWDYETLRLNETNGNYSSWNKVSDIKGNNYVGGIVGLAKSTDSGVNSGEVKLSIIHYCSVNASLEATSQENNNIGGILSCDNVAVIYNAYFMGKLTGNLHSFDEATGNLYITNNNKPSVNNVYSVVYKESVVNDKNSSNNSFVINSDFEDTDNWLQNININAGYIYVSKDKVNPIFQLAPTSIDVSFKNVEDMEISATEKSNITKFANDLININLIEYKNAENTVQSYDLSKLINITSNPYIENLRYNIISSDSNVIAVNNNGTIQIKKQGTATITIYSVLNENAKDTIAIVVNKPIGQVVLSENSDNNSLSIENSTQNIAKNTGKLYYIHQSLIENDKAISTNDNVYLKVNVKAINSNEENIANSININDYLNISNVSGSEIKNNEEITIGYEYIIAPGVPFSVSVNEKFDGQFEFSVIPYIKVTDDYVIEGEAITFKVKTAVGITDISLNYDDLILYPNDVATITANISSDVDLIVKDGETINFAATKTNLDKLLTYSLSINRGNVNLTNIEEINGQCKAYFNLDLTGIEINQGKAELKVQFNVANINKQVDIDYTILNQRINKLEIKNYVVDEGNKTLIDVIRPVGEGLIILDIVPANAYYDYLEISDITGNEEIAFVQVDEDGNRLSQMEQISSDGKGIKLIKQTDNTDNRYYIATKISNNYSSKIHTIQARAYLVNDNNDTLLRSDNHEIFARMLPEINISYQIPSGIIKENGSANYLANGTYVDLLVDTKNSDGDVIVDEFKVGEENAENYYNFEYIIGSRYRISPKYTTNANLNNKDLILKLSTKITDDNGNFETDSETITFKILPFVIHDISVNNSIKSIVDNKTQYQIYGNYNNPVELEFYFDKTDTSSYDNRYNSEIYRYNSELNTDINNILKSINENISSYLSLSYDSSLDLTNTTEVETIENYVSLTDNAITVKKDIAKLEKDTIKLKLNSLNFVMDNDHNIKLQYESVHDDNYDSLKTYYKYDKNSNDGEGGFVVYAYDEETWSEDKKSLFIKNGDDLVFSTEEICYSLNFIENTAPEAPALIESNYDLLNMVKGQNYILTQDLTLSEFSPIDSEFASLDGNGHTITINNFATVSEQDIKLGLFKTIYEGSVVKNLTVKYPNFVNVYNNKFNNIQYYDVCSDANVDYTSANFGGLVCDNFGIITNCEVVGLVSFRASTIEAKTPTGQDINFNIAGLVNTNSGYITNSTSRLSIFGQANIAGFVKTNTGKISSSSYEATSTNNKEYGIYAYNSALGNTINVKVAGFVLENNGYLNMSFVDVGDKYATPNMSKILANGYSVGFVYKNSKDIEDCYVNILQVDNSENEFSGFVATNSGKIATSYTNINKGNNNSYIIYMFAPYGTNGLTDCVQIYNTQTPQNIQGLHTVLLITGDCYKSTSYPNFAFGNNKNAVWQMVGAEMPKLSATTNKIKKVNTSPTISGDITTYYGLTNITKTEIKENVDGYVQTSYEIDYDYSNYGTKQNPYIIYDLASWNKYFSDNTKNYYRIVCDIDFSSVYNNPTTSSQTMSGNIQGNNMSITGLKIYSTTKLESIGLFKAIKLTDYSIDNAISNIKIDAQQLDATKTSMVGVLAGVIENYNLYNIQISGNTIVVGGNAVGGLAGAILGNFDIDKIYSSIGANSTRVYTSERYSIYHYDTATKLDNISNVYYAGSVAGIINKNYYVANRDVNAKNYNQVRNIKTTLAPIVIGEIVGGAFGFVGESVKIDGLNVDLTGGNILGSQFSGGAVGENRGIIINANINLSDNLFNGSRYVVGGAVGFNNGGLIDLTNVKANIKKSSIDSTIGGIVGRNVNGYVVNSHFDGEISAYFTGGIIGSDYSKNMITSKLTGANAINVKCHGSISGSVNYKINNKDIVNLTNVSLSKVAINYWIVNNKDFYSYLDNSNTTNLTASSINYKKVLGLFVGVGNVENAITFNTFGYDKLKQAFVFNGDKSVDKFGSVVNAQLSENALYNLMFTYIFDESIKNEFELDYTTILYPIGVNISEFDSWDRKSYADLTIVFTNQTVEKLIELNKEEKSVNYSIALKSSSNVYLITASNQETGSPAIYGKVISLIIKPNGDYDEVVINDNELSCFSTNLNDSTITNNNTDHNLEILKENITDNSLNFILDGNGLNVAFEISIDN